MRCWPARPGASTGAATNHASGATAIDGRLPSGGRLRFRLALTGRLNHGRAARFGVALARVEPLQPARAPQPASSAQPVAAARSRHLRAVISGRDDSSARRGVPPLRFPRWRPDAGRRR